MQNIVLCPVCDPPELLKNYQPGSECICDCGWQDSGNYSDDELSCPNYVSLNQARKNYQKYGAISKYEIMRRRKDIIEDFNQLISYYYEENQQSNLDENLIFNISWSILKGFAYDNWQKVKTRIDKFFSAEEALALYNYAMDLRSYIDTNSVNTQVTKQMLASNPLLNLKNQATKLKHLFSSNQHLYIGPTVRETLVNHLNFFISLRLSGLIIHNPDDNPSFCSNWWVSSAFYDLHDKFCKEGILNSIDDIFDQEYNNYTDGKILMINKINESCTEEEIKLILDFVNDFEKLVKDIEVHNITHYEDSETSHLVKKAKHLVQLLENDNQYRNS